MKNNFFFEYFEKMDWLTVEPTDALIKSTDTDR